MKKILSLILVAVLLLVPLSVMADTVEESHIIAMDVDTYTDDTIYNWDYDWDYDYWSSDKYNISLFSIASQQIQDILTRIQQSNNIPSGKKAACGEVAKNLLNSEYEASFVAGLLANICEEGNTGIFEYYNTNTDYHPNFNSYLQSYYSSTYSSMFSGKYIYNLNVTTAYNIFTDLSNRNWNYNGTRIGTGLGSIQWTFGRAYVLVNLYREVNGNSSSITQSQALMAECLMIQRELTGPYKSLYTNWKNANSSSLDSQEAAYDAGRRICVNYEVPADAANKGVTRGNLAKKIFADIAITPPPTEPILTTNGAYNITTNSATLAGTFNVNGHRIIKRGFQVGTSPDDLSRFIAFDCNITWNDGLTHTESGFQPNTTYYYRLLVCNDKNNYYYGNVKSFTTVALPSPSKPTLTVEKYTNSKYDDVKLHWTASQGAEYYDLRVYQNGVSVAVAGGLKQLSYNFNLPVGKYRADVAACNSTHGTWVFSEGIDFEVTAEPTKPIIKVEKYINNIYEDVSFSWTESLGADYYDLRVYQNGAIFTGTGGLKQLNHSFNLPAGKYRADVAACNSTYGTWTFSEGIEFEVTTELTKPIIKVAEYSNSIYDGVSFNWTASQGAEYYDLRVYQNGVLVIGAGGLKQLNYNFNLPTGNYRADVASCNGTNGTWTFSDSIEFEILNIPGKPVVSVTSNNGANGNVNFSWLQTLGTEYYDFRIWKNNVCIWANSNLNQLNYSVKLDVGEYEVDVASCNGTNGTWTFSKRVAFAVLPHISNATKVDINNTKIEFEIHTSKLFANGNTIVALYNNDVLVGVKNIVYNDILSPLFLEVDFSKKPNSAKIFTWNSLSSMIPLSNKPETISIPQ